MHEFNRVRMAYIEFLPLHRKLSTLLREAIKAAALAQVASGGIDNYLYVRTT